MYGPGPEMPVRVRVALTVLGMAGNPGDAVACLGDMISLIKQDKGDAPAAKEAPRKLTPDEEKVRKAALDVLHLYLSGAESYTDEPQATYGPAIITPEGQRVQLTVDDWGRVSNVLGCGMERTGSVPEPAGA